MKNTIISDVPNGFNMMEKETHKMMNLISKEQDNIQAAFPKYKIHAHKNRTNDEGVSLEMNKYTLTCQPSFAAQHSATNALLVLKIHKNVVFNDKGYSVDENGKLEAIPPENKLKSKEYELFLNPEQAPVWKEAKEDGGSWTSEELADKWIKDYVKIVDKEI